MKVIVEKDVGWFDYAEQQTEFAMFDTLCRAYGVEVELVHDVAVFKKERVVVFEENVGRGRSHEPVRSAAVGR